MGVIKEILHLRPENVMKFVSKSSKVCLVSSNDIFTALKGHSVAVMACNTRIRHVIPGIMHAAMELDAIVGFELAKSECDLAGGYTGMTPKDFTTVILQYAEDINFHNPFFIHSDHLVVKNTSRQEIDAAKVLIAAQIEAGYTSFAIDASYNEIPDNVKITAEIARVINERNLGLETEVGEIKSVKSGGSLTTPEEASEYIHGLVDSGIRPNLLAINNGSKHGHYAPDEKVFIDLKRTKEIYEMLKGHICGIAQHGITGTPPEIMQQFPDSGILKGNVGTLWQDVAHEGLPPDLLDILKNWALENKKDLKSATKVFKKEIDSIPQKNKKMIEENAYMQASSFMKLFRSKGTASLLIEKLGV